MSTDTFVEAVEFEGDFNAKSNQLVSNTVLSCSQAALCLI